MRLRYEVKKFGGDRRGNVAMLFAFSIIPVIITFGVAIDYGRALIAKQRLGAAIDSAALAVGSSTDLTDEQVEEKAQRFFEANFSPDQVGAAAQISVASNEHTVTISASAHVDTTFLKLAGFDRIDVGANTEVTKKQRKIELVMVLDNTGSMSWDGKIDALKDASRELVDVLFGEQTTSDDVKIGLVPFAAAVNIGTDSLAAGWIDANAQSSIAGEDFQPGSNALTLYDQMANRSWNGCVRARPAPYDTEDEVPSVAVPDTLWVPYLAPDEPDFWWYANGYASDDGYGGDYWDYDARQRFTGKYAGLSLPGWEDDGPDSNCRTPAVTPMTNVKSQVTDAVDQMVSTGSTVIPAGLAWGWRLISPGEPFTEGAAYDDDDTVKAMVLLTDGRNDVGGGLGTHNNSYYSAYGFARSGHVGATNGSQAESVLNDKTTTLCDKIKARNIRLYTITFQLDDGPIKDLMRDCATKASMYYDSPSNAQLQTVFEEIGHALSELRISK